MTVVFKFVWSSTTVNLVSGINDVDYIPAAGDPSGGFVTDRIVIQVDGSSHDNLATLVQSIDLMRVYAMRYRNDRTWELPVWLHAKMDSESTERRAFVRNIDMNWNTDPFTVTGHAGSNKARYTLRVERGPWEALVKRDAAVMSETAGTSLVHDYTATGTPRDLVGDIPARLESLTFLSDTSGAALARLWLGFRSAIKHGALGNFVGTWELENGANNGGDVTDDAGTDVNGASPGGGSGVFVKVISNLLDWDTIENGGAADDFIEVCEIELQDVSANERDNFGAFLWLLRAMLPSNATTWEVQLSWGYSGQAAGRRRGPIKEVSGTAWDYFEMGREALPIRNLHVFPVSVILEGAEETYAIKVWARRTSGAADLYLDCLCPVPVDEGWLKAEGFSIAADTDGFLFWGEGIDGSTQGMHTKIVALNRAVQEIATISSSEFRMPVGDGRLVIVYAGSTSHDLTTGISLAAPHYYERWLNLRGGE